MISIGKVGQLDWFNEIVKAHAPEGTIYFTFVPADDHRAMTMAHDVMIGLVLTGKGNGTLTTKHISPDYFFERAMIGFFA